MERIITVLALYTITHSILRFYLFIVPVRHYSALQFLLQQPAHFPT